MANQGYAIALAVFLVVIVLIAIGTLAKELAANQSSAITHSEVGH